MFLVNKTDKKRPQEVLEVVKSYINGLELAKGVISEVT